MKTLDSRDYLYNNFFELKKAFKVIFEELELMKLHASGYNKIHQSFKKIYNDELSAQALEEEDTGKNPFNISNDHSPKKSTKNNSNKKSYNEDENTDQNELNSSNEKAKYGSTKDQAFLNMCQIPDLYRGFDQTDLTKGSSYIIKILCLVKYFTYS